jgi:hypothetical protein
MKERMSRSIVLRVLTRCSNVDEFVATFRRFSTDTAIFVPTRNQRDVGAEAEFSIRLVDGKVALAGVGEIAELHASAENAFGKPGIVIEIHALTVDSRSVFDRLRRPVASTERVPEAVVPAGTDKIAASRADVADMLRPTAEMPPLFADGAVCEVASEDTEPVEIRDSRPAIATTLGVAPLAPATYVSAPFVIDTPIPRWPRGSLPADTASALITANAPPLTDRERTAMVALDRTSGQPQIGPWQAFCARLAKTVRGVRWWLLRRRTTQQLRH